ncbi:MAG: metallophosphoesterase family protein [Alphaproteobacteria bacterium]|nr:metallophosphoesterase family protein [Alphaproteobacteria bacterium]
MAIFFTSDTHFGHGGALGLYRRPFASVPAMNEAIVARWNETVGPGDDIWHLGDFAIHQSATAVAELLNRLNGNKHLLTGNNDPPATTEQPGWTSVKAYAEMMVDGVFAVLCHYPFRSWRDKAKGSINLHGHCHGRLKPQPRQFDVGVDVWDFRPITIREILARNPRARQLP